MQEINFNTNICFNTIMHGIIFKGTIKRSVRVSV